MNDERDFRNLQPIPMPRRFDIGKAVRLLILTCFSAFLGYQFGALRTRHACLAVLNEVAGELHSIREMGAKP